MKTKDMLDADAQYWSDELLKWDMLPKMTRLGLRPLRTEQVFEGFAQNQGPSTLPRASGYGVCVREENQKGQQHDYFTSCNVRGEWENGLKEGRLKRLGNPIISALFLSALDPKVILNRWFTVQPWGSATII
jgi:hypothetical protein